MFTRNILKSRKYFEIPGYEIVKQDRTANFKGGVVTMIKENIKYVLHRPTDSDKQTDSTVEYIRVDIAPSKSRFTVVYSTGQRISRK